MTLLEEIYEAAAQAAPSGADEELLQRLCPVVNVIATLHPFHLLGSLQFLRHTLGGFHLLHDGI